MILLDGAWGGIFFWEMATAHSAPLPFVKDKEVWESHYLLCELYYYMKKYLLLMFMQKWLHCSKLPFAKSMANVVVAMESANWQLSYNRSRDTNVYILLAMTSFCGPAKPLPFNSVKNTSHFYGLRDLISALPLFVYFVPSTSTKFVA